MGCHLVLTKRKLWSTLFVLLLLVDHLSCKRGGGGGFGGRGSGGARMGASRGSSGARTGGGFGSGTYNRGGYNPGKGGARTGGNAGAFGGGVGGAYHNSKHDDRSRKQSQPSYTKGTGIGSMARSSTFKNMIVGAAAGYLTYQAGKAIIRHAVSPMMWNNRPYYWGSNYYPQRSGQTMCRMPIDSSDQQFGNIYFSDNSRPREIVWGCGMNEHCCGYECCPSSYGGGGSGYYSGSGRHWGGGIGLGTILTLLMLCACGGFIIHQLCKTRRATSGQSLFGGGGGGGGSWFGGTKYTPGQQV